MWAVTFYNSKGKRVMRDTFTRQEAMLSFMLRFRGPFAMRRIRGKRVKVVAWEVTHA